MYTQKSYLFITWEGGGNLPPVFGLAQRLLARGHRVRILSEPCLRHTIESMGAEFVAFKKHFTRTDRTVDIIQDWNAGPLNLPTFENILFGPAMDVAQETLAAIQAEHTDVVVADLMMVGSLVAAEAEGIARVALFHMPEYLPGPNRPPGGFGLTPKAGYLGRFRDGVLSLLFNRVTNKYLPRLNAVRGAFFLPPMKSVMDIYQQADLRLIQTCRAFDFPIEPAPSNVRYVGPVLDDPDWAGAESESGSVNDSRPLVVVSLSSTFQNQRHTLENAIEAMAVLPIKGLVTLGPAMAKESFHSYDNITVASATPHSKVFPTARAVVTHAGHGTVMRALANGLPLVCLPMGRDQTDNAARIVHHGAGLSLSPNAKPHQIARAIQRVLTEPEFTKNAERLKSAIVADANANQGVIELEEIASNRFKAVKNPSAEYANIQAPSNERVRLSVGKQSGGHNRGPKTEIP